MLCRTLPIRVTLEPFRGREGDLLVVGQLKTAAPSSGDERV